VMDLLFDSANVIRNTLQEIGKEEGVHSDLTEKTLGIEKFWRRRIRTAEAGGRTLLLPRHKDGYDQGDFKRLDDLLNLVGEL